MDSMLLQNLGAYSAQVAVLVALAGVLGWVLRLDAASVRYGFWRAIFALCLLLPLLQGRQAPSAAPVPQANAPIEANAVLPDAERGISVTPSFDWTALIVPVLFAGAAARLLWLAVSLGRLRRLRRLGVAASRSELHADLVSMIDVDCEIRYVPRLRQPVTFGLRHPVVLLPTDLAIRSDDIQRAVLSHELFHVKRRDWGWLVVEEIVCALLWFNPAVWWLVSRLQLAREVVVDELAVLATGRRRAYVEALMTFADRSSLAPAAAFGSRAQLFKRIVLLSKEAGMSSRRLVFSCAVAFAALGSGAAYAVSAFPLSAPFQSVRQDVPGPLEQRARPVTPENPVPRRTNYEPPAYPMEARAAGAWGRVTLMLTLDELGRIAEARRLSISVNSKDPAVSVRLNNSSRSDEARFLINRSHEQSDAIRAIAQAIEDSAFRAVQQWRYEPPFAAPLSFPVTITVAENADESTIPMQVTGTLNAEGAVRVGDKIRAPMKIRDVKPVYPPAAQGARVSGMVILEIIVGPDGAVREAQVLRSIPLLDQAAVDAVMQWRFTPTLLNGQAVPVIMTVTVNFTLQGSAGQRGGIPEELRPREVEPSPAVVKEVKPVYPAVAFAADVQGFVEVEAMIGTDGTVTDARIIRSIPLLDEAALEAVRQWKFTPPRTPRRVTIELSFTKGRDRR
jgi:protein TonB